MALEFIDRFEIELTNHCNAKCVFCPRDSLVRPKGFMSPELFQKAIEKALALKVKAFSFSGFGEPLLHPSFLSFLDRLRTSAPAIAITLITNGSLLTREVITGLKESNIEKLLISFNGYDRASYESNMCNLSFNQTIGNLKYLAQHGGALLDKLLFRPVLTKTFDQPQFRLMQQLIIGLGFRPENVKDCFPCINRGGYLNDPELIDPDFYRIKGAKFLPAEKWFCYRFVKTLQIAWNGDILLCCNDINNEANLGNILTSTAEQIQAKISLYRDPRTKPDICRSCNDPFLRGGFKKID